MPKRPRRKKTPPPPGQRRQKSGRSRGMWFDREMFPYCGNVYRVRQRISRFIDERSGKMVVMKKQAVTLNG